MGTKAKDTHSEAPCQNEGPSQEASSEAAGRNSRSGEAAMPSKGRGEKCTATLCNRLLCQARESSSRPEGRNLCAGGRHGGRHGKWEVNSAGSTRFHATGNPEKADQILGLRAAWEPPLPDMCAGAPGSETLLQQGAPRPPEGRVRTVYATTHTSARTAGQPAHPGGGGHASTQATHGTPPPPPGGLHARHGLTHPPAPDGGVRGMK